MFFILQLSRGLGVLLGVAIGAVLILFASAWAGIPVGVALGGAVGCLAGLLPPELVRHGIKFSLRRTDTHRLRQRLRREHGLALLIIEELVSRGEPVGQFREEVESLLHSRSMNRRSIGRQIRRKWFPDMPRSAEHERLPEQNCGRHRRGVVRGVGSTRDNRRLAPLRRMTVREWRSLRLEETGRVNLPAEPASGSGGITAP